MFEYDRLGFNIADKFTTSKANNAAQSAPTKNLQNCHDSFFRGPINAAERTRYLSGGGSSMNNNVFFDCGRTSTRDYGSLSHGTGRLGGTPMASPAPNVQYLAANQMQLHKMFFEHRGLFCDNSKINGMPVPSRHTSFGSSSFTGHFCLQSYEFLAFSNLMKEFKTSSYNGFAHHPPPSFYGTSPLSIEYPSVDTSEEGYGKPSSSMPPISSSQQIITQPIQNKKVSAVAAMEDGFSNDEIAQFSELLCGPKRVPSLRYQCHICLQTGHHYIDDCSMRFNLSYDKLTPYQGRKICFGEFHCQQCRRNWTSRNSVANEAQFCIKCQVPVFPYKQHPMDKAVALGFVKSQKNNVQTKIVPIGHGQRRRFENRVE